MYDTLKNNQVYKGIRQIQTQLKQQIKKYPDNEVIRHELKIIMLNILKEIKLFQKRTVKLFKS